MPPTGSHGARRLVLPESPDPSPPRTRVRWSRTWRLVAAGAGLVVFTGVLVLLGDRLAQAHVLLLYLLVVVIVGIAVGWVGALVAAVVSYLATLYWFTPPRGKLDLDGHEHFLEPTVFLLVAALVGLVADAAERRRQQLADEVARNRQLDELDRVRTGLLSAVSHDLRTPLTGIKANAAALRYADPSWSPEVRLQLLTSIEESADQLTDMVSNVLDLGRLRAGALKADLTAVALDDVVGQALAGAGDRPTAVDVAADLPAVWADPSLLERVLANLLANAHEHASDGQPILVHADRVDSGVRVSVVDHGPGIDEDRWAEVFRPFQRLTDTGGGIGLGLAIAQGYCEAMGTTLTPAHTPGGGLTMSVVLAVAP